MSDDRMLVAFPHLLHLLVSSETLVRWLEAADECVVAAVFVDSKFHWRLVYYVLSVCGPSRRDVGMTMAGSEHYYCYQTATVANVHALGWAVVTKWIETNTIDVELGSPPPRHKKAVTATAMKPWSVSHHFLKVKTLSSAHISQHGGNSDVNICSVHVKRCGSDIYNYNCELVFAFPFEVKYVGSKWYGRESFRLPSVVDSSGLVLFIKK